MLRRGIVLFIIISLTLETVCEDKGTVAFVIDNTSSMSDDIDKVKIGAKDIVDIIKNEKSSQFKNIILVTFNDPGVSFEINTTSYEDFKYSLDSINVVGGGDCPEYSLSGIETSLINSFPGSTLFVYTDASAKDYIIINRVKALVQRKQSQVIFVLTGDCGAWHGGTDDEGYKVYYEIAAASAGQVFRLEDKREVESINNYIKETIKGKKTILTSKIIPPGKLQRVTFTVDDKIEYAIVSASGSNVFLKVENPEVVQTPITWIGNVKVLKLSGLKPGDYTFLIKGGSITSAVVFGRTDFTFQHGFSISKANSLKTTSKQPIAGKETYLHLLIDDPEHSTNIKTVQILDMSENVLSEIPLKKTGDNFYTADPFISPNHLFKIAVKGTGVSTGIPVRRISRTAIDPQKPPPPKEKAPKTLINEGSSITVEYNSELSLTCKVSGYPEPEVVWSDETGNVIPSKTYPLELPYLYMNYVTIPNLKSTGKYYCNAKNKLNANNPASSSMAITVKPALSTKEHIKDITNIEYGKEEKLRCVITSRSPMKIDWIRTYGKSETREKITNSDQYVISPDEYELKIKRMDISLTGKYICIAYLKENEKVQQSYETIVNIVGLAKPEINKTEKIIRRPENSNVKLNCKVVRGSPKPKISWQFNGVKLYETSEVLILKNVGFHNSGQYKCTASNIEGTDRHAIQLDVEAIKKAPTAIINEGTSISVLYNTSLSLTCTVTSYPEPRIIWADSTISFVPSKMSPIKLPYEYMSRIHLEALTNSIQYFCKAFNDAGSPPGKANINIVVQPPFTVHQHIPPVTNVEYGMGAELHCNITSHLPMQIKWTLQGAGMKIPIATSDKYSISPDGTTLKLKEVTKELSGKYMCTALLVNDDNVMKKFETMVNIVGLVKPEMLNSYIILKKYEKSDAQIVCPVTKGYPKPEISWQFNGAKMEETGKVLTLRKVGFYNSGKYTCTATNVEGNAKHTVRLIVEAIKKAPTAIINEGTSINVLYNTSLSLTCTVTSYPEPRIVWTDSTISFVPSKMSPIKLPYEYMSRIHLEALTNSIQYFCKAFNDAGSPPGIANINIVVQPPFTVHQHIPPVTNVEYGMGAELHCNITSHLPMQIKWTLQGAGMKIPIANSDKYSISPDGTTLKLKEVTKELSGKYMCTVLLVNDDNVMKNFETMVNIVGLVKPEMLNSYIILKKYEKSDAQIVCPVTKGYPKPEISWQFNGTKMEETGKVLTLRKVGFHNSGKYTCTATNVEGNAKHTVRLIVEGPPHIKRNKINYDAVVGDIVLRLPCVVLGNPKPLTRWQVNDTDIFKSKKYSIEGTTLVIHYPREDDTGKYKCIAKNDFGVDEETVDVLVTPELNDLGDTIKKVNVLIGTSVQVKCPLKYKETDALRWFKNEYPMNVTASYIDIRNASFDDDGNYTCRVSSTQGSASGTVEIEVGYPPRFKSEKYEANIKWPEDYFSISCAVDSKPKEYFTWYHNGVEMGEEFKNTDKIDWDEMDWGNFTCKVTNPHGTVERSFVVESDSCIIDRNWKTNVNVPVILDEDNNWPYVDAKQNYISLRENDKFLFSCHSDLTKTNFFTNLPKKNVIEAICDKEDKFIVDGKSYKLSELTCKENVTPHINRTGTTCLNDNTELVHVGFIGNGFINAYDVCYDRKMKVPMYSKTELLPSNDFYDGPKKEWREHEGFGKDNEKYKCNGDSECCYIKSQLVNPIDVFYGPAQTSTFIDHLNSIPALSSSCDENENWETVGNNIRGYLEKSQGLCLWSGVSQLMDVDGLTVPRYLWKVVREEAEKDSNTVAIVYVNDKNVLDSDKLCDDICDQLEWMYAPYSSIYCCHLEEFVKAFNLPLSIFSE